VETAETVLRTSGADLWQHLAPLELFSHFTDEQRSTFLQGYERETGMRVVAFGPKEKVCDKGKYELDLCFVLKGTVDLLGQVTNKGYGQILSLPTGAFYGELGALGGLPRSTDVAAGPEGAQIFYLPRYCLKYLFVNPEAREQLNNLYRERAMRVVAAQNDLFKGVPKEFVDELIPHTKIDRYDLRGIVLVKQGDIGDALYIVRDGYVQVATDSPETGHRALAYLRTDDYFGEIALLSDEERKRVVGEVVKESGHHAVDEKVLRGERDASVLTAGKCEVIRIPAADFRAMLDRFPDVHARVYQTVKRRLLQTRTMTPEISAQLERSGQLGYIQADALLVMDLDLCVKCDQCVKACETLHGVSRLNRTGGTVGKYLVPAACRHCDDPKCMNSCPTGAIKRRPEGEIYFQYDMCVGCGNCAIACPYDNIAMIETAKFDAAQARKSEVVGGTYYRPYPVAQHAAANAAGQSLWQRWFSRHDEGEQERVSPSLFQRILGHNAGESKPAAKPAPAPSPPAEHAAKPHIPPAFPIKCDLCDGLPFMGCVHSCPTGAAMRISGRQLFEQFGAVTFGSVRVNKSAGGKD
jgi:CRP-like cAMP-binding protein/Fe-S-cluster-containing hydrogenase component 2